MSIQDALSRLKGVKKCGEGWSAKCPNHDDRRNSLSISKGRAGKVLLYCHAGCAYASIISALFGSATGKRKGKAPTLPDDEAVAIYPYQDEQGRTLYEVLRFEPKDFRPRIPDHFGGYKRGLPRKVRRVLYRLPELRASNLESFVFIVEGEKDVDALRKLGLIATCNVGGAGKWLNSYNETLRNRHVCIVPDNDPPGHAHAVNVARALKGVAASLRIVILFPEPS